MKLKVEIDIVGSHETFMELAGKDPKAAGSMLSSELQGFNRFLMSRGMDTMGRYEEQIVREYIGFKVVSAEKQHEV